MSNPNVRLRGYRMVDNIFFTSDMKEDGGEVLIEMWEVDKGNFEAFTVSFAKLALITGISPDILRSRINFIASEETWYRYLGVFAVDRRLVIP